jgi:hypothetical protein
MVRNALPALMACESWSVRPRDVVKRDEENDQRGALKRRPRGGATQGGEGIRRRRYPEEEKASRRREGIPNRGGVKAIFVAERSIGSTSTAMPGVATQPLAPEI